MNRKKLAGLAWMLGLVCVFLTATAEAQSYPVQTGRLVVVEGSNATGTVLAGQSVRIAGGGFNPGATIRITIESDPVTLGTVTADGNGAFSAMAAIPTRFPNGDHTLKATGISRNGTLVLSQAVVVQGGTSALPVTGSSTTVALLVGASLVGAGGLLVILTRHGRLA